MSISNYVSIAAMFGVLVVLFLIAQREGEKYDRLSEEEKFEQMREDAW